MSYYVKPSGREATFECSKSGRTIKGRLRGLEPKTLGTRSVDGSKDYPYYEVITVNDLSDVVEHRKMEPIFYMTDDPSVLKQLGLPANYRIERARER